ncbi:hypothetical protein CYMTET_39689 [Cymbomonas tetramitiformis]|uniref:Mutator-like transposase domain-containing protein n=1 Tax=Cymbomonas tetramitiformis TaxID=36881 RepID=A0AAE0C9M0_9CHLO|nr:hypothetical protein CYMTET_39689 [Cymbomonas tetramitiformis]
MAKESCANVLIAEAMATKDDGDIRDGVIHLHASGDAAWPNRGSGRSYSSFCGMFVLVGAVTRKISSASIFDKMCYTCEHAEKQKKPPPEHDCWRGARAILGEDNPDWRGSSKAMEAAVEKNSDPNHLQKLFYKALETLRVEKKWTGTILSVNVIKYFNKLYRHVVKSTVGVEEPGLETDEEKKADWKIHVPGGKFLDRTAADGYYEGVRDVMARFAKKELIMKKLHTTDTNANESINGMVVKGYLPGGKAQQNGQSGVYGWACCHTIVSKNEGHAYRQELCRRLGIEPPASMIPLDLAMDEKRTEAAEDRRTHKGKARRLHSRIEKPSRNEAVGKVQATYATGDDLNNDRYGNKIE